MKEFFKKYGFKVLAFIIISFIANYVIFRYCNFLSAGLNLTKADWLIFCGSFLSFVGSVFLGTVALWQNEKANDTSDKMTNIANQSNELAKDLNTKNLLMQVRPYLIINSKKNKSNLEIVSKEDFENKKGKETDEIEGLSFYINQGGNYTFDFKKSSDATPLMLQESNEFGGDTLTIDTGYRYQSKLINVGNRAAISVVLSVYKQNDTPEASCLIISTPVNILKGFSLDLCFYIENEKECMGNYYVLMQYRDIYENNYSLKHRIVVADKNLTVDLKPF